MNDVEPLIRHALHGVVDSVDPTPDPDDVRRRVVRRRQHRRLVNAAAAAAIVALALGGLVVRSRSDRQPTLAGTVAVEGCSIPRTLPFQPTQLPGGQWQVNPYNPAQGLAVWMTLDVNGVIEVWNGGRGHAPEPETSTETITVLGQPATIGAISDGYSVTVQLGPTRCDRWTLVAHPSVTLEQLRTVALNLAPTA